MKWDNIGHQFDDMAGIITSDENKYLIWGAGTFGKSFYNIIKGYIDVRGVIDSDSTKSIDGITVYSPDRLAGFRAEGYMVIVANGWITECFGALREYGYVRNVDCFHANEFLSVYMFYRMDKIYAISVNIPINTLCTLKCEKCMALMPYAREQKNFDLASIQNDLSKYFKWVDYVSVLGIGGGDVLLHPQLANIIEYIGEKYWKKKCEDIEIYTNAIILPNDDLLRIIKKYDCIVRFSDYQKQLPSKQKIEEMISLLDSNGIRYDRAVWDTWYDIGFPQKSNGVTGRENLQEHYESCITGLCAILYREKLYYCSVCANAVIAGWCPENPTDYFDVSLYDISRRAEFLEFNAGYCENGFLSYCMRCDGYQNNNKKYVPVAKQIVDIREARNAIFKSHS